MSKINDFDFFENRECRYYPCHEKFKSLNCLFCYCPLYHFPDCGGSFKINALGIKDCSECTLPHDPEKGYSFVIERLSR